MIILCIVLAFFSCALVNTRYSLYHSDINRISYPAYDCLYAHFVNNENYKEKYGSSSLQSVPYCRRPDNDLVKDIKREAISYKSSENIVNIITFSQLKQQGITSNQLLAWFAPMDVVEKYERDENSSDVFYNCSIPWFGSFCQYRFNHNVSVSFEDIIEATFYIYRYKISDLIHGTCYRFLSSCNNELWPMCLDWRQICDGLNDCESGEDEQWCEQLEFSQCEENEFRCHYGGQCISLSLKDDNPLESDCLDDTDEKFAVMYIGGDNECWHHSTFQYQERTSRYPANFQCGDGQYLYGVQLPNEKTYCMNLRDREFTRVMLTSLNHIPNINCQQAFDCALHLRGTFDQSLFKPTDTQHQSIVSNSWYINCGHILAPNTSTRSNSTINDVSNGDCPPLSEYCMFEWLVLPARPIFLDFFQFVYFTNRSTDRFKDNIAPDYVCFNETKCPVLLVYVINVPLIDGLVCFNPSSLIGTTVMRDFYAAAQLLSIARDICLKMGTEKSCRNSSYFYCNESMKCISKNRVRNGYSDCYYWEDELINSYQEKQPKQTEIRISELFSELCNLGITLFEQFLQGQETDETDCDWWPCSNPYTRCDYEFHCLDGNDELNCSNSVCPFNEYECQVSPRGETMCLSKNHLYDKYLAPCQNRTLFRQIYFYNETSNISDQYLSWKDVQCLTYNHLCRIDGDFEMTTNQENDCSHQFPKQISSRSQLVEHLQTKERVCRLRGYQNQLTTEFFTSNELGYYPTPSMNLSMQTISTTMITPIGQQSDTRCALGFELYCFRGILVLDGPNKRKQCLCPPQYFGDRCEWQSQRISLTLKFTWYSATSSFVIFQIIIMLIDHYGSITPYYEQILYLPTRDCFSKYNLYLLYPDRPKSLTSNYSIRIDLYEKKMLTYWGSWHLSIPFHFLPVNRIATQLHIPQEYDYQQSCLLSCGLHGKCTRYINKNSSFFCYCDQGYSGTFCNITYECSCAKDSICLSSSICVCPVHKLGSLCYVKHPICHPSNNPCQHNGLCIPNDDRIGLTTFTCLCSQEYSGERCQNRNVQIVIHFNSIFNLATTFLYVNLITAFQNSIPERVVSLKKIPFDQKYITLYAVKPFNILFIQMSYHEYYLAILREKYLSSEDISTEIQLKHRCHHIKELLNETYLQYKPLRRVKYYPFLCRKYSQLKCFRDHDENLMCICDVNRFSNCFFFNFTANYDCRANNVCKGRGQCIYDGKSCPTKFSCICQDCFYGERCQYSTSSYMFSLDPILGYHIQPNVSVHRQPFIIQISITILTIMFIIGLVSGCLSVMTFRREKARQVGTGNYLLLSSISSILMLIVLMYKFWFLILTQKSTTNNRLVLKIHCILLDFMLKVLLAISEWLSACVAIERAVSVKQSTSFNKTKSKQFSKWIMIGMVTMLMFIHIHDPLHRELADDIDIDQKRTWCLAQYSSTSMKIYNSFLTLFHFLVPFSINVLSAIWLILSLAQNRAGVQCDQSYKQNLQHQFDQHRHLLIAPCLLIILSLPRLIISFISGCMRSARQPWLYLIGYFLSFIPSMFTFIVFVLPSETYRGEFRAAIQQINKRVRALFSHN